jgi:hypothetical protein
MPVPRAMHRIVAALITGPTSKRNSAACRRSRSARTSSSGFRHADDRGGLQQAYDFGCEPIDARSQDRLYVAGSFS